jgi:hypothetical protein
VSLKTVGAGTKGIFPLIITIAVGEEAAVAATVYRIYKFFAFENDRCHPLD